jgi:glucosamine--fructose-6-phosphate aminotransferase (isomerizing)
LNAGPEIGVASTKAFTSQIIAIVLIALQLGQDRISTAERRRDIVNALHKLPQMVKETLRLDGKVKEIAERLKGLHNLIVLGRGYNHAASLEAYVVAQVALR